MRPAVRALAAAVLAAAAFSCTMAVEETHFFHPGAAKPYDVNAWKLAPGATAQDLAFRAADGTRLHAVRIERPDAAAEVLYFGGDSFRSDLYGSELAGAYVALPVNVTMIDYRGYGPSEGTPTLDNVKSDALGAFDEVAQRAGGRPLIIHGFSLGSFIGASVTTSRKVDALVLESTATNVSDWAHAQVPRGLGGVLRIKIAPRLLEEDNAARVRAFAKPLLLIVGDRDRVTPAAMSRQLLDVSQSSDKQLVVVPGADHGEAFERPVAVEAYRAFVGRIAAARSGH